MFALIWVILLFADRVAGSRTETQKKSSTVTSNSSAAVQSTVATNATSTNVSATTQETKTFTSTITVSLKPFHNTTKCVSDNSNGAANLSNTTDLWDTFLRIVQEQKVYTAALVGFVVGIFLSSIFHCLVAKSCRKKQKTSENLSENLEMVTTEAVPMMDPDQAAAYDEIHEPQAAEGEAQCDGQSWPDGDLAPKEVEYSDINFSAIKTRNPEEAENRQDNTDTEYAEIKREEKRQENSQEDSEMLEGNEEKELITGEDNDAKKAEEEGGGDVALYSSVDEIMG
ncbi:uncharacterized protein LOC115794725 isoform X1 [Archocentrus centrarchus]|uniref:uncharacterized protein LOC115794725 isoform X1 n=1 Tax=Archocentrus centrarchus TaxID=63155 RepID=UPI0011E9C1BA|nr:uncharacterized protein LOC115794725 isoform X1 [Archocentrus centrarchus]